MCSFAVLNELLSAVLKKKASSPALQIVAGRDGVKCVAWPTKGGLGHSKGDVGVAYGLRLSISPLRLPSCTVRDLVTLWTDT